jgi:Fe-coproporphyrin III synthase
MEVILPTIPSRAPGPAGNAILQIHPSLRCNLSCTHCYSSSGPAVHTALDVATVCGVITDAAAMGYEVVSISGGEPFLYIGLDDVLAHAKSLGLRTTVTTNGFFTRKDRLNRLRDLIDALAISLDGTPEIHNEIRGSIHAFRRLEAGLEYVRTAGVPFGFIHCLTQRNWEYLLWVANFAAESKAGLLQIHPLELAGRASSEMSGNTPKEDVLAKVYVLVFALAARYEGIMKVQLDLLYRDHLREEPGLVYAEELDGFSEAIPAQLLGLLVLEADGTIVPVSYGFSRSYKLCNVKEQRLFEAWPDYLANGYPKFRTLCRKVWNELCEPRSPLLCNWHEVIVSGSHEPIP